MAVTQPEPSPDPPGERPHPDEREELAATDGERIQERSEEQ